MISRMVQVNPHFTQVALCDHVVDVAWAVSAPFAVTLIKGVQADSK